MRFDFHPTTDGWRISEANSDVPGGFTEASFFGSMMAEQFTKFRLAGCPTTVFISAIVSVVGQAGAIGLLSAPGYMEDCQVMAFLADRLRERNCVAHLTKPEQIVWRQGIAHLETGWHRGPLDGLIRFYQAEWLAKLPDRIGWKYLLKEGKTPVSNPAAAIITESKRFPLLWPVLSTPLPTWRRLLPETAHPQQVRWRDDDSWLLKTAFCNTGDSVSIREYMPSNVWRQIEMAARWRPGRWVAQKRFRSNPIATPIGDRHVCVGIYTVNGLASGAYARLSEKPVIDFSAADVALLIEDDE
jgi:glutathionylspermidine synthase